MTKENIKWWMEEYGFFGKFYMEGDNSVDGYLIEKKQSLSERTMTEVNGVEKLLNLQKNAKIMDCPCGYGRHSNELSRRGYNVVGCDINTTHLNAAIKTAKEENLKTDFRKQNMLDINFSNEFDAVINMFYSFGFFDTDEENFRVLKNFYNSLKTGGKFLMHTDVNLPQIFNNKYKIDEQRALTSNNTLRIIDNYNANTKRIEGKWIINNKNGETIEKDYSVRVYSKEEFEDMCREAGFSKTVTYSSWNGDLYSEDSEDMMVVATK